MASNLFTIVLLSLVPLINGHAITAAPALPTITLDKINARRHGNLGQMDVRELFGRDAEPQTDCDGMDYRKQRSDNVTQTSLISFQCFAQLVLATLVAEAGVM